MRCDTHLGITRGMRGDTHLGITRGIKSPQLDINKRLIQPG